MNCDMDKKKLVIYDSIEKIPNNSSNNILISWNKYFISKDNHISLLKYIDENKEEIRNKYLVWINNISKYDIKGKSISEHLQLTNDSSTWWMSNITGKCNNYNSLYINDLVKLLALIKIINSLKVSCIDIKSSNKDLINIIKQFSYKNHIDFEYKYTKASKNKSLFKTIYNSFPLIIQSLIWLIYQIIIYHKFIGLGLSNWESIKSNNTFVTYFLHSKPLNSFRNSFQTTYWGDLPQMLIKQGNPTRWIHINSNINGSPNIKNFYLSLINLNQSNISNQAHVSLYSFMSIKIIARSLRQWLKIVFRLSNLPMNIYFPSFYGLNVWKFFKKDWCESTIGRNSLRNILYFNLFKEAFSYIYYPNKCFYIFENQAWEYGMLKAWNSHVKGDTIANAHSTIRFWDLRYYNHSFIEDKNSYPTPTKILVNGKLAKKSMIDFGYPIGIVQEVEALRYNYLSDLAPFIRNYKKIKKIKLLVLGDYSKNLNNHQMLLLNELTDQLSVPIDITIKSHPSNQIKYSDYPKIKFMLSKEPLVNLLKINNIAFASSGTSAALDIYYYGIPLILSSPCNTLNFSPLLGLDDIQYVSSTTELSNSIKKIINSNFNRKNNKSILNIDAKLNNWYNLILQ